MVRTSNIPIGADFPTAAEVGAAVLADMVTCGVTVPELADALRLPIPAVQQRLTGAVDWLVPELITAARHLGVRASGWLEAGVR
ncbi:hypothetical protein [Nocardia farcinica]|uniref:Uncharacterized protein n=1 Tax=Nocardia farcinica (strain IFM 10152) TaxID=247156 RepID=Q5Z3Y3_NOCFA|nr:hypothetical protein [Nocardia farcinica]BAD54858.1 hypothetical protein NFA_160 [Nocardia farcinica IFM 10152]